ncbi:cation transporter [Acinetobacter sp. V89_7]|uniref:heavy-metal-associated domain-containing protein n=1 Tax=Acinetobacter sp. V89_7 TaxID=3044233 RepID=UPI00249D9A10|nr:cation transporter [Acinetobacter sp. V89_7]MDI3377454.1 cation transporter [Acinetobacter sp. V89_7]
MSHYIFHVEGMSCSGCSSKIKSALSALEHVQNVEVDLASAEVKVYSDAAQELNRDTLVSTIEDLGFDVVR